MILRRLTFSIFLFIVALSTCLAQETSLGARGGFNLSTLGGNDYSNKFRFAPYLGAKINIYLEEKMSLQPEVSLSWQGARDDEDPKTKFNFTFVNIPVIYKYWIKPEWNAYGGPQMGIRLSAKSKYDGETTTINNHIKSLDFGFVIGSEYYITDNIAAELRFNLGFSNLLENPFIEDKFRQRVVQLGGSYYF